MALPRLLIIDKHQFGSLTDSFCWCKYLRDYYDIKVLCFDVGFPKKKLEGVFVRYVPSSGPLFFRGMRYLLACFFQILFFRGKILVVYFDQCILLKRFFPFRRILLDIRTLSISPDWHRRAAVDNCIREACLKYDVVSVISEGIRDKLRLGNKRDVYILPLGADCLSLAHKDYSDLKLLYVGTFSGRNLAQTIEGLALFRQRYPEAVLSYDIIGDGYCGELEELKSLVCKNGLEDIVRLHGRLPFDKLSPYFGKCNIGVSYVPITDYYDNQPPTKTFEYAQSGLYVIATKTKANCAIISEDNGVLIGDTATDFSAGLAQVYIHRGSIDEQKVRESLAQYTWKNIVKEDLVKILERL